MFNRLKDFFKKKEHLPLVSYCEHDFSITPNKIIGKRPDGRDEVIWICTKCGYEFAGIWPPR